MPDIADGDEGVSILPPTACALCNHTEIRSVRFQTLIPQGHGERLEIPWWQCSNCRGWFMGQIPSPEVLGRHMQTRQWLNPSDEVLVGELKQEVNRRVLNGLALRAHKGELLDIGANFGNFLVQAHGAGWSPVGFEPDQTARERARGRGFDVRDGWNPALCGFRQGQFQAITVIDTFCYSWHPFRDLQTFHALLSPNGVLAMRVTNKRQVLGSVKRFIPAGTGRNIRLGRLLQGQFHSIATSPLARILENIGFADVSVEKRATTAPLRTLGWKSRAAYRIADIVHYSTLGRVNLSPGVLVFARKKT